ncbi:MAG: putative hydrolase of the superfamily [Actinomycetota bacterium]|jgi:putative hydrolase of the HAD superfamily|nr:putative hydrolase of the superfamily [Actinomycetota bacterium]
MAGSASGATKEERPFDALIVDFGGVLTNPLQESLDAFATSLDIELQDLVRVMLPLYTGATDDVVERFEKGTLDEAEFSRELARRLEGPSGRPVEAEGLVTRIFAGVHLEPSMLDALATTRRQGMKTALLSNSWGMSGYPKDRFEDLFDVVVISGEVGLRKPDPAIFQLTVGRLGVAAAKCLFIDDYPAHLEAAKQAGMTTLLHLSPPETLKQLTDLLQIPLLAH